MMEAALTEAYQGSINLRNILHTDRSRVLEVMRYYIDFNNALATEHKYRIKTSHITTISCLLGKYADQMRSATINRAMYEQGCLPFFKSYNGSIQGAAELASDKSAKNHRRRLQDTGVFIDQFATRGGLRIVFNPIFFLHYHDYKSYVKKYVYSLFEARKKGSENPAQDALNALGWVKFTPIRKRAITRTRDIIYSVDNVENSANAPTDIKKIKGVLRTDSSKSRLQEHLGQGKDPAKEVKFEGVGNSQMDELEQEQKLRRRGRPKGSTAAQRKPLPSTSLALVAFIWQLIERFWDHTEEVLYHEKSFSAARKGQIRKVLMQNYFIEGQKKGWGYEEYWNFYAEMIERMEIARGYFERYPHLSVPEPELYFAARQPADPFANSKMRFYRTYGFLVKNRVNQALTKLRKEVFNHQKGKGPHRNYSTDDLYRIHEKRMMRLNYPGLMDKFYSLTKTLYFFKK